MRVSRSIFAGVLLITVLLVAGLAVPRTVAQDSSQIRSLSQQQYNYMQAGQYEQAINTINQIIELDPNNPDLYYERGGLYVALSNKTQAIEDFQKAASLYENSGYADAAQYAREIISKLEGRF